MLDWLTRAPDGFLPGGLLICAGLFFLAVVGGWLALTIKAGREEGGQGDR